MSAVDVPTHDVSITLTEPFGIVLTYGQVSSSATHNRSRRGRVCCSRLCKMQIHIAILQANRSSGCYGDLVSGGLVSSIH